MMEEGEMMEEGKDKGNIQPSEESLLLAALHSVPRLSVKLKVGLQPAKKRMQEDEKMEEGNDKGNIQPGEESLLLAALHSVPRL